MQRPRNWSLVSFAWGIGKGMGNGMLIGFGELVGLLVNVGERKFYAVRTPPIRIWSAVSHEDGLQVMDRFGGEPHIQVSLVLLPVMAMLLSE